MYSIPAFVKTFLQRNRILLAVLVIYVALTVYLSYSLNIWIDEAYALNTTSKDVTYSFVQAVKFENQAPLYFVLLRLWRYIDNSILFARLFSVLCIAGSICLLPKLSQMYLEGFNYRILLPVFAFNPIIIWASTEIRSYALIVLITSLTLYFFYQAYLFDNHYKYSRILFIIIALLGVYTQYYFSFLTVSMAFLLLTYKKWGSLTKYIIDMSVPALSLILILPAISDQMNSYSTVKVYDTGGSLIESLKYSVHKIPVFIFGISEYSIDPYFRWFVRAAFLLFLIIIIWKYRNKILWLLFQDKTFLLPVVLVMLLFFSMAYYTLGKYFLLDKHAITLVLPLMLSFLKIISLPKSKSWFAFWVILISAGYFYSYTNSFSFTTKYDDTRDAAKFIMQNEQYGQPIYIYRNELALPFKYYYSGINKIRPLPAKIDFNSQYNHTLWVLKDANQFAQIIKSNSPEPFRFWLVTMKKKYVYGVNYNTDILEEIISANYRVILNIDIPEGLRVRLLQIKTH